MWASRSGRSPKMSNHEQFAHILHQKWTTISESLRSLTKNEQIACFFEEIANLISFSQKPSDSLRKPMSKFPALQFAHFWCATWVICSHHSLKKKKWANHLFFFLNIRKTYQKNILVKFFWANHLFFVSKIAICLFAHFVQIKWATVSDSLRSLKTNEQLWANRSGRSYQKRDREQIAHDKWGTGTVLLRSLTKNERFAQQFLAKKSKILFFSMFYIRFYLKKWANPSFPLF